MRALVLSLVFVLLGGVSSALGGPLTFTYAVEYQLHCQNNGDCVEGSWDGGSLTLIVADAFASIEDNGAPGVFASRRATLDVVSFAVTPLVDPPNPYVGMPELTSLTAAFLIDGERQGRGAHFVTQAGTSTWSEEEGGTTQRHYRIFDRLQMFEEDPLVDGVLETFTVDDIVRAFGRDIEFWHSVWIYTDDQNGRTWHPDGYEIGGTARFVSLTSVPEPPAAAVMCVGVVGALMARRSRRRRP